MVIIHLQIDYRSFPLFCTNAKLLVTAYNTVQYFYLFCYVLDHGVVQNVSYRPHFIHSRQALWLFLLQTVKNTVI